MTDVQKCIVCGSGELTSFPSEVSDFVVNRVLGGKPVDIRLEFCRACSMVFYNPRFDAHEMDRLYAGYRDDQYNRQRLEHDPDYDQNHRDNLRSRIEYFDRFCNGLNRSWRGSVLDFGGLRGEFINAAFPKAEKFVYDISGVAPVDGVRAVGGEPSQKFDFIVCAQVLEHVADPGTLVDQIKRFSHARTRFYFAVPMDFPPFQRLPGRLVNMLPAYMRLREILKRPGRYPLYEHVNYFCAPSLRNFFETHGFEISKIGLSRDSNLSCLAVTKEERMS